MPPPGHGELRVGRRVESFVATELDDDAKIPVIRAYLVKWAWEVGKFFEGLSKDASDEEIAAVAPGFPVFALEITRLDDGQGAVSSSPAPLTICCSAAT